jgi:hypothetical protein
MHRSARQFITIARRLIALCASLWFFALIAASGPHLVHHLADLDAGHSHPPTRKSQSTDCLVLSLMQHAPLVGDFFTPLPASLPTAEQASAEQQLQMVGTPRPAFQARSPPTLSRS